MHETKFEKRSVMEVEMEPAMVDAASKMVAETLAVFGLDEAGREIACEDTILKS